MKTQWLPMLVETQLPSCSCLVRRPIGTIFVLFSISLLLREEGVKLSDSFLNCHSGVRAAASAAVRPAGWYHCADGPSLLC